MAKEIFKKKENDCGEESFYKEVKIPVLSRLNFEPWTFSKTKTPGEFAVLFETNDSDEYPSQGQINGLKYLVKKEQKLFDAIYTYVKSTVYPVYAESMDIEEEDELNSIDDLPNILGLQDITITKYSKSDTAYFIFLFDFRLDREHQLFLIAHKNRFIHFCGMGDLGDDCISKDLLNLEQNDQTLLKVEVFDIENNLLHTTEKTFDNALDSGQLGPGIYRFVISNGNAKIESGLHKR